MKSAKNREKGKLRSQNSECLLEGEMFRQNPGVTGPDQVAHRRRAWGDGKRTAHW